MAILIRPQALAAASQRPYNQIMTGDLMKYRNISSACLSAAFIAMTGLAATFAGHAAHAAFPERPVRLIVPFAPGGGTDMISRLLAEGMARELKQPVIVENKPGAGTTIGSDEVARARPDGYTLLMATFA